MCDRRSDRIRIFPENMPRLDIATEERTMIQTSEFRGMLRSRILEILDSWPAADQYAIMFFINPNEANEYRGYSNLSEFAMVYKCDSDLGPGSILSLGASDEDEEKWNPAFWEYDLREWIIGYDEPDSMTAALIDWYESIGVQNIGFEDTDSIYNEKWEYIGRGPNGHMELLQLAADIAAEFQREGILEKKLGRRIPIILADYEFTWYMIKATAAANPNGEADEYIGACLRGGYISDEQLR